MAKKHTDAAARPTTRRRTAGAAPAAGAEANDAGGPAPTHDEIAEAAYRRYLNRGGGHGRDVDDWVEAERELRQRKSP